jgi:hypothetical protein
MAFQRCRAVRSHRSGRAAARNHVANAIGFELLREGPLLVDVLPFAFPKRLIHFLGTTKANDFELGKISACLVAGIFEHSPGLAAAEQDCL